MKREEQMVHQNDLQFKLPKESFLRCLRRILPNKGEQAMQRLEKVVIIVTLINRYPLCNLSTHMNGLHRR